MAEQKRRCTIKYGFDYLRALVPSLAANPNLKISKAALLVKVSYRDKVCFFLLSIV